MFNAGKIAYFTGLLHDLGKYSLEFQQRIRGKSILVDHSTAGAKEAINLYGNALGMIIAYCIAGHHSGLQNYGTIADQYTLCAKLRKEVKDYSPYRSELEKFLKANDMIIPIDSSENGSGFSISFFIRMLYSCLVDADFLDTEKVLSENIIERGNYKSIKLLNKLLNEFMLSFKDVEKSFINTKREEILSSCIESSYCSRGVFSLTVPTGGGKTYSSLAFALNHALKHDMDRVIYVIPYTSIIEQNAQNFKKVLGNDNVLEHHSNYLFDKSEFDSEQDQVIEQKLKKSSENWDAPIIVTTNIQFFESLFANRSSKCRKIHNISNSVIIFDEAQMLPTSYLKPCLSVVTELVLNYKCSVVLCTATQPSIEKLLSNRFQPIEIINSPEQLYLDFKRVSVKYIGEVNDDCLSQRLLKCNQVLCIVNKRKHARLLFERIKDDDSSHHLSTLMCPIHRSSTLEKIKNRLKNGLCCRVISTQLIEAGVDIDFPEVYRAEAGIDSIVQSAGRCNREGKKTSANVFVFNSNEEYSKLRGWLALTSEIGNKILREFSDPISIEAVKAYFDQLYDIKGSRSIDQKEILTQISERENELAFPFSNISSEFNLIDDSMISVVIQYDNKAIEIIEKARFHKYPGSFLKKLQPYSVSIYENEYKSLVEEGVIEVIQDMFSVLKDTDKYYCKKIGLIIPERHSISGDAIFT